MEEKTNLIIKEIVENFLNKLSVDFDEININNDNEGGLRFSIKSNDSGILIGGGGNNIKALNHLIKQIIWKNENINTEGINFFIDVNDYQFKNIEKIKNNAIEVAKKAVVFRRNIEMDPMSSFERMIVHSTLSDNPDVTTESTGEGPFRRINIIFKN